MNDRTGIEITFDVHTWLESWTGPTSTHDFLRMAEIVVVIDAEKHVVGGEKAHFFPCAAGEHDVEVHIRTRNPVEVFAEMRANLFASLRIQAGEGTTRLAYHGRPGLLGGRASLSLDEAP